MTFGESLRQILRCSGIKSGHLAEMLGYDPSYISRWMNNEKLPSEKNNVDIFYEIANCVLTNSDKETHGALTERIGLSVAADAPVEVITEVMTEYLRNAYLNQKNVIENKRVGDTIENNCMFVRGTDKRILHTMINNTICEILQNSKDQEIEIIDTCHVPQMPMLDDCEDLVEQGGSRIHIKKIISYEDYCKNIDEYSRLICAHLINNQKVYYDFYFADKQSISKENFILIGNRLFVRAVKNSLTGKLNFLASKDETVIDEYCRAVESSIEELRPIYDRVPKSNFLEGNMLYNFMMQSEFHYIMPVMHLLYTDKEACPKLLERYKLTDAERRKAATVNPNTDLIMTNAKRSVMIFKTAFLDYIFKGKIMYAGTIMFFEKEERINHLQMLIGKIRTDKGFSLQILEDVNPKICYSDMEASVFVSDKTMHATCYFTTGINFCFSDTRAIAGTKQFLVDVENLSDKYLIKGEKVIEFIEAGIRILEKSTENIKY